MGGNAIRRIEKERDSARGKDNSHHRDTETTEITQTGNDDSAKEEIGPWKAL